MKKIVSLLLSGIIATSMAASAFAVQIGTTNPIVRVDGKKVYFADQEPVIDISANRTLVPVRGVFEKMGATVTWVAEDRRVILVSDDNLTRIELQIDSDVMQVYKRTSLFSSDLTEVKLDTTPIIYNNRTIMPIRAVCEAMGAKVDWRGETHTVVVNTKEYQAYLEELEKNKIDGVLATPEQIYDIIGEDADISIPAVIFQWDN